jgi:ABC-2 type transport system permease protein
MQGIDYTTAISDISNIVKNIVIEEKSNFKAEDIEFLDSPVTLDEVSVVGENSAEVSASTINSMIMSQGAFVPMIIFVIIVFASQMIVTAISTEKIDKTLETLLSTPISRVSILTAKMLSAGLVSLISAVVYMIGFSISMGSLMTTSTELISDTVSSTISTQFAMLQLGLVLSPLDYILIGLDIFLSIMIALSLSMMLGVMVNDIKSTQLVMMPVIFMAIIPYLISYFVDVKTISPVLKIILYLIPFTHTFNATSNLMFGQDSMVWLGIVYQVVVLVVCMFFALRLFQSDKILTATLNFSKKKKIGK